jgi:hypothetical protein
MIDFGFPAHRRIHTSASYHGYRRLSRGCWAGESFLKYDRQVLTGNLFVFVIFSELSPEKADYYEQQEIG